MNTVHIEKHPTRRRPKKEHTAGENPNTADEQRRRKMKRYMNTALVYAFLAMIGGVFYREFTKMAGFTGRTTLGFIHTHYFMLGMVFFLLLVVMEKNFAFTGPKTGRLLVIYHLGLNLTAVMLAVRGVVQVMGIALSTAMEASISGIAGIGHILLGVSMVLVLMQIKQKIS